MSFSSMNATQTKTLRASLGQAPSACNPRPNLPDCPQGQEGGRRPCPTPLT